MWDLEIKFKLSGLEARTLTLQAISPVPAKLFKEGAGGRKIWSGVIMYDYISSIQEHIHGEFRDCLGSDIQPQKQNKRKSYKACVCVELI